MKSQPLRYHIVVLRLSMHIEYLGFGKVTFGDLALEEQAREIYLLHILLGRSGLPLWPLPALQAVLACLFGRRGVKRLIGATDWQSLFLATRRSPVIAH